MKKFLSIILSILMVVTMIPMAVLPASATGAQAQVNDNFKVEITRLVYTDSSGTTYDYTDTFNSWALYDLALTNVSDGECQLQYTAALLGSDGETGWDNDSVTLEGVSCDSAYTMSFKKNKIGSTGEWKYTIQISKTVGHAYSDWSYIDDEKHSRICAIDTDHTINGEHSYNNGFCDYCNAYQSAELNENGYYEISNAGQLYWFAGLVNGTLADDEQNVSANAVLMDDITVNSNVLDSNGNLVSNTSGLKEWTQIGDYDNNGNLFYQGTFDGQGYTVSGLYHNSAKRYVALVGINSGTVCNVTVANSYLKGSVRTGGIVGWNEGSIYNCASIGCVLDTIDGYAGGIASYNNGGKIYDCYNTSSVSGTLRVGGICGSLQDGTVTNCYNIGAVTSDRLFGGIVGTIPNQCDGKVENCYFNSDVFNGNGVGYIGIGTVTNVEGKTTEQLASGEVAFLLGSAFGQSIDNGETVQTAPVLGGAKVYYGYVSCDDEAMVYTNDSRASATTPEHSIDANSVVDNGNGTHSFTCTVCGDVTEPHTGGTATCKTQAVCEVCEVSYGELDPDNHEYEKNNGFCCDTYEPAELKDGYYQIKNGGNLFWYANYINTVDRTANAVLTADIDLENRPWTPIGSTGENSNNFRGIFDGQNYTIRGLYVEGGRAGLGFFGEVRTGTVKNFTIYGEVVVNTEVDYVGGVIGSVCGLNSTDHGLERNGAIIQNIKSFVNLTAKAHGVGKIGGFVGYANHQSLIENCSWYGTFDAGIYRVDSGAGGFIGKIQENTSEVTIRNCGAYGTIKTNYAGDYNDTATIYMGGFLSFSNTSAKTTLENCLFAGKFERGANLTDQAFLGAFGTLRSVNAINNCYYLGDNGLEAVHSDSNLKPGSDNVEIIKVTEEQLKSGEVAYKLQEANEIWGQSIGTDSFPVLGGEEVYYGYIFCDDEVMVYTNDSRASDNEPDHSWDEGVLTRPTKTADGYYTYTCTACGEATKTEKVERAANYDDYTKALDDLRAYLDSDMLTDENKGYISQWLATYDTDEVYGYIAGEEAIVQEYIDATAYYAYEIETAIEDCLAGNHSGNGETCEICGTTIKFATITGVSVNVDGVVYTSDNTSAENPAVINPDSVVTFTVTGENFDLLPAGPENAVIGFTYFSQNLEWLYNNPSKYDIDTVNNTVSFPANYDVLYQATTASELTYTNDGWKTDIGSGVYVIYIDKKDIADTLITLDNTEFIYSGYPIEPTVLVMADGQVLMAGEHYTLTFESNVNAGTASVTVKGIGDYAGEVTKDFTITKAYYTLTAPTPNTLTYNGEEQYLVAAGTVEGADFEYSIDGVSWSTSIPLAKETGNYTVYYRVLADENHYGIEGTVDVTIKECPHEWGEGVLTRPVYDAVLGSKDGYYTYTCTLCGEEKTETVKSADYSAYEAVSEEINALLQSDELIPEAKQAIYSAANECGHLSNDLMESEQNIVDDLVEELEKIVADAEEKIASGEYVKIDGIKEYNKIAGALDAELMENYSQEEIAALAEKAGDEIKARLGEIIEKAEALTGSVAENKDALAEIESEMRALYGEMKNCLDGVHNGLVYEVTEEAKCEVNAIESATCTLCGETDEREIEGTALEHEPNEQMCKGYWCSRCRSFYGEGNPDIHLDGYSSTGKIKDGQCDGCNKQLAFIKSGETYEINSYAYVVEFAPVVDGRYILTVDGPEGTEIDVREVVDGVNKGINCEVISDLVYVVDCTVGKTYRFEASNYYGYNISSMTLECETHKGTVQTCYGYICDACGEYFGEVPGHDIIIDEAVPPTCTQTGLTEGQHCSRCDDMTIIQEKVPATNHKDTLVKVDAKAATCTEAGWEAYEYCTACDYTTYEEIPALKHSFTKYEVTEEAECGKAGKEVAYCDHGCQTTDEREIPALKHSFTKYEVAEEAECGKAGKEVASCDHGCGATDEKEIPALTHEPLEAVKENEVAPKCGVAGSYDLVVYCDICGEELDRDTVTVDALTHKDEDGDYLCDHGCGHEFQKPSEPDTPDTPDEPTDNNCDHLCHKTGFVGFIWKIIRFFFKLFDIQQYCDCGALHY